MFNNELQRKIYQDLCHEGVFGSQLTRELVAVVRPTVPHDAIEIKIKIRSSSRLNTRENLQLSTLVDDVWPQKYFCNKQFGSGQFTIKISKNYCAYEGSAAYQTKMSD